MSEFDSSDQHVFVFSTSSPNHIRICVKFCVHVPWVDPYLVHGNQGATLISHEIMGNFVQLFGQFFKKSSSKPLTKIPN